MAQKDKVLLIEDGKVEQLLFKRVIEEERLNYDYCIADSIAEAKKVLAENKFDVVITDFTLGDGTAFDIFHLTQDAPIIVITGGGNQEIAVQAMKLGAADYLIKDPEINYLKILPLTIKKAIKRKQAEKKYRLLSHVLMNIKDSVYITDSEDKIIFVNQAFCKTYGYQESEVINNNCQILWSDRHPRKGTIKNQMNPWEQEIDKGEFYHKQKGGKDFPVFLSCSVIQEDRDCVKVFVANDITQHKQAEAALQESQERFRSAFENAPIGMALVATDGRWLQVNRSLCEIVGYSEVEMLNLGFQDLTYPEDLETNLDYISKMLKGQIRTYQMEKRYVHKKGHLVWILLGISLVVDNDGKPLYFIAQIQDISARKRAEEEQQKFVALVENSSDFIGMATLQGNVFYINESGRELVGIESLEEVDDTRIYDYLSPETWVQYRDIIFPTVAKKETWEGESQLRHLKTGQLVDTQTTVFIVKHPQTNAPMCLATIQRDITERKRAADAIKESEERFQLVARATNDAVWDWDVLGTRVWRGPGFQTLFGYSLDEIEPNLDFWMQNIHPDEQQKIASRVEAAMSSGESYFANEYLFCCADGTWVDVLDRGYLIRNEQGQVTRLIGAMMDISDRKRAEKALKQAKDELEVRVQARTAQLAEINHALKAEVAKRVLAEKEVRQLNIQLEQRVIERTKQLEAANKELEAFSYSVSHDLRSPLRSIDGFSQALLEDYEDQLDDFGKDYLRRVRAAAQRMGELIDDLLQLSRLTRSEMKREQVDLSAIALSIATQLQETARETRTVEFIIPQGIITTGDGRLLRILLENLLGNAWKYTSKHPTARIEFGIIHEREALAENTPVPSTTQSPIYFVRDDGAGFDMAYASKLFGVFQRLHGTNEFEGTGIGLATVQRIVHRHGGSVWAQGTVEQGATFYFTLGDSFEASVSPE